MSRSFHRLGALLVLACTLPLAQAQPVFGPGPIGHGYNHQDIRERRDFRETQRLETYSRDVLRNHRKECGVLQDVREERDGQVVVECLSYNNQRELRYVIEPSRGHKYSRVILVSNEPRRGMDRRDERRNDRRDDHRR